MTDVPGGLITLEYALEGLNWKPLSANPTAEQAARDEDLKAYIRAATPVIERITGRLLPAERTKRFNGGKSALLLTDHIESAAAVTEVTENEAAIEDYVVDADARIIYAGSRLSPRRFLEGVQNIAVTYAVGYGSIEDIPQALKLATRELVRHMVQVGKQSPRSPSASNVPAAELGRVPEGFAVPARVVELCEPYRLGGFA